MSSSSVMRIEDLVSTASLEIRLLAGARGVEREVLWAHSCEMERPERWLAPHELLMTVGLCIPVEAAEQIVFVERLHEAGLAGFLVGAHPTAPGLTPEMLKRADELAFPVLSTNPETPFAVVARHVAAASASPQLLQVLKLGKLYRVAATTHPDLQRFISQVARMLRVEIRVEDRLTGLVIAGADPARSAPSGRRERRYALRLPQPAEAVTLEHPEEPIESFVLVHLLQVLEVAVERELAAVAASEANARDALERLLAAAAPVALPEALAVHSAADGFRLAAVTTAAGPRFGRAAALRDIPVLAGPGRDGWFMLVPQAVEAELRDLAEELGEHVGASSVFTDFRDVRTAADEASRMREAALADATAWAEYSGTAVSVLSRSRREAEDIITGVLGSLAEESSTADKLRMTLFSYLRHDRHWQLTADDLGIHRQTLRYRLGRIEEETGRSITASADLSAFWVAYQAWLLTHGADGSAALPGVFDEHP